MDTTYFDTLGIERGAGRVFATGDLTDAAASVVVTESLARRLWPDRPAVGARLMIGCDRPQPAIVIGVVRDSAIRPVGEPPQPHVYRVFAARHAGALTAVLLDTTTDPAGADRDGTPHAGRPCTRDSRLRGAAARYAR